MDGDRGRFFVLFCFVFCFFFFFFVFFCFCFVLELRSFRLYLGASHCTYFLAYDVFILMSLFFMSCI